MTRKSPFASPISATITPLRQQYLDLKAGHPDALMFFRLGDFYELFDADAEIAARELDLVLTSRPVSKGDRVPMAGVPHHALDAYIARLVAKGHTVAVVEQLSEPDSHGIVKRHVTRVVSPSPVVDSPAPSVGTMPASSAPSAPSDDPHTLPPKSPGDEFNPSSPHYIPFVGDESFVKSAARKKQQPQRAYTLVPVGDLPPGTLGMIVRWESRISDDDAPVFVPQDSRIEYFPAPENLEILSDDFDPADALDEAVLALARLRQNKASAEAAYDTLKHEWEAETLPYKRARDISRDEEAAQYEAVARLARVAFAITGDKHPDADVQIKDMQELDYDPVLVITWALHHKRHDLLKITVDEKALREALKHPKSAPPPSIAQLVPTLKPFISTALGHRLKSGEAE